MNDRLRAHPAEAPGIYLAPFQQAFFEEAAEHLAQLEPLLLRLDPVRADEETLHAVFRCVHSVKGGAAAFGFGELTALAHQMETLLDPLRRRELAPSVPMIDLLLQGGDALRALLAARRSGGAAPDTQALQARLRGLAEGRGSAATAERRLQLTVGPLQDRGAIDALLGLFSEITDLGRIEPLPGGGGDGLHRFELHTGCSDADLLDLCAFHVERALLRLAPMAAAEPAPAPPAAGDAASLRVPVHKVDALINLAGELVTTESILAQGCAALPPAEQLRLAAALAELQRHTRALQEAAMAIRMIPVSAVFARFPRMLRELAARTGKTLQLRTLGEATELDKGMIEQITDPLTHLLRNACDHGIEPPAERLARGKPAAGTITLAAAHAGGSIVIEVRDDGRGLSRTRLLAKARERGLHAPDNLADAQVWALIFAPGLSTAEAVTDVSGRGVGMDVVKKNIAALGGAVELDSIEGQGLSVRVRLPLTLAILDGMTVRVADECYVLPLAAVVESFHFTPAQLKTVGGSAQLVPLRDAYLPVLELRRVFDVPPSAGLRDDAVMVVVEAAGARVALRVDELLGQQQVVVKNLETNLGAVEHVAGATLMGDGRVALILDVGALVRTARR